MNLTLEFGSRADLPVRIAIANSASEIAGAIGPLLGGVLAAALGFQSVFIASILFLIISTASSWRDTCQNLGMPNGL